MVDVEVPVLPASDVEVSPVVEPCDGSPVSTGVVSLGPKLRPNSGDEVSVGM